MRFKTSFSRCELKAELDRTLLIVKSHDNEEQVIDLEDNAQLASAIEEALFIAYQEGVNEGKLITRKEEL